ncbi:MAG: glycosyltransferase family 2 protein [Bacteriovoracaceae bacterium]
MVTSFDILIVAGFGREGLLLNCLASIKLIPNEIVLKNIFILFNGRSANEEIRLRFPSLPIKTLETHVLQSPGSTRNKLIQASTSEFLLFLDDDVILKEDYFLKVSNFLSYDLIGGVDGLYDEKDEKQVILARLMSSPLITGPTYLRHYYSENLIEGPNETILTLCNLWVRRSLIISKGILFNENLLRCEENPWLIELKESGARSIYLGSLQVGHYRRVKFWELLRTQLKSGYYRGQTLKKNFSRMHYFFLLPLITPLIFLATVILYPWLAFAAIILHALVMTVLMKGWKNWMFFYSRVLCFHLGFSFGLLWGILVFSGTKTTQD